MNQPLYTGVLKPDRYAMQESTMNQDLLTYE